MFVLITLNLGCIFLEETISLGSGGEGRCEFRVCFFIKQDILCDDEQL
jgi:hypothetical protein